MQRSRVVLPEPLGPITTTTCLRLTNRSIPSNTVRWPKRLTMLSARTISSVRAIPLLSTRSMLIIGYSCSPSAYLPEYQYRHYVLNQSQTYVRSTLFSPEVRVLTRDRGPDGSQSNSVYSPTR